MPTRLERANAIRALTMDAVEKAGNGHPGAPMGMADLAEVLWRDHLQHDPSDPTWANRDRFVLSNGHGSMLLYALLHLTGYAVGLDDLKSLRQWHSKTPGHPEVGETPGVETTTGPLGQGFANAVGLALAEKILAAHFNRPGHAIVNHHTWVFLGDGCMMEGISHEAASLAGALKLGKLKAVYDDNGISIDGPVTPWFADDTAKRFEAYGWRVIRDINGHDGEAIHRAMTQALADDNRPTLICARTVIGYGAPNKGGTASAHGSALGANEITLARKQLSWTHGPFEIPNDIRSEWSCYAKGQAAHGQWRTRFQAYAVAHPELAREFERRIKGELPEGAIAALLDFARTAQAKGEAIETRKASGNCLDLIGPQLPELIGGSADLAGSNNTQWKGATALNADNPAGQHLAYGVREFAMSAIANGLALHGGIIPYTGTFLTFMDYARNALRLSALMKLRNIYVYTHDSLAVGEDGPTHQPVEHLTSLRTTPGISTWRPADLPETAFAWKAALERRQGPTALVLSRQKLPAIARTQAQFAAIERGAYVLLEPTSVVTAVVIATGSEVQLALHAAQELNARGHGVRVVSMPSADTFLRQDLTYREAVLPSAVRKRAAIEAAHPDWWYRFVGLDGLVIGVDRFGASAPGERVMAEYGFSNESVTSRLFEWLSHKAS